MPVPPRACLFAAFAVLLAGPAGAQSPRLADPPPTTAADTAWRVLAREASQSLAATIAEVEARVLVDRDDGAWRRMDCHSTRLAELRGLRRAVADASEHIDVALKAGHPALVLHHWDRLLATRAHTPLLVIEALSCNDVARPDLDQVGVVRVRGPAWDDDVELGKAPPPLGR